MSCKRSAPAPIDCVGAPTLNASLRSLRPHGRVVVVGNVDARRFELNLGYLPVRDGRIRPRIHEHMPLERAADTHRLLEARGATGRVVLIP